MVDDTTPPESAPVLDFDVSERRHDGVTVLSCRGDLDAASAPRLTDAIGAAMVDDPVALVVDLTLLDFLSSAGMSVLVEGHDAATERSIRFGVIANGPRTSRPMELIGLNRILVLYPTLDAALAKVRAVERSGTPLPPP